MKKRMLSALLALSMVLVLLSGCNKSSNTDKTVSEDASTTETGTDNKTTATDNETTAAESTTPGINFDEEPYEVNYLYLVAQEGPDQDKVNKAVNERALKELNMKVNLIPMTVGTFMQQVPLMLASNEPLDILPVFSENFSTYIDSQYIINMHDYLEYAPDAIEILGDDALAGYIGDFFVGFSTMKERSYPLSLVVRKDIFNELGYSVDDFSITTDDYSSWDKITEMFSRVNEKYPNMNCFDGFMTMGIMQDSFVDKLGSTSFGVLENNGRTTTVTNWYESEQFKAFAEINREWFTKGYSSQDIAVTFESGANKMKAGNAFSFVSPYKPNTNIEKYVQTGYEVEVIPLSPPVKKTSAVTGTLFAIANASKDPKKAMQFLNWTYKSQEFNDLINWGIEGEHYIINDEGMAAYPEGVNSSNVGYHNDFGFFYPNQFAGHAWVGNSPDIWDQYRVYNDNMERSEAYGFTFDSTAVANEEAQLNSVLGQYIKDISFGSVDVEPALKKLNDALYNAGIQKAIDEKQRQLDEWLSSH